MELEWIPVKGARDNPEAVVECDRCHKKTLIHPNFTAQGITACIKGRGCDSTFDVINNMVSLRGWKFVEIETIIGVKYVHFSKPETDHVCRLEYSDLRRGKDCKTCTGRISKGRTCDCIGTNPQVRPRVCIHYNHLIKCPRSAKEWDYEKNYPTRPEDITPVPKAKYWWKCSADHCKMSYEQSCGDRISDGGGCPYCAFKSACFWNCLEAKFPEAVKEWHVDNKLKPSQILPTSKKMIKWQCFTCSLIYLNTPSNRFGWNKEGCPRCNHQGYAQQHGGYDHFVAEARKIHGDKYDYPGTYINATTKIDIYCKEVDSNGIPHGLFSQLPCKHKSGGGCSVCSTQQTQSKGMTMIEEVLKLLGFIHNITYIKEHTFKDLKYIGVLRFDVWIDHLRFIIEYDGEQHFKVIEFWGGEEALNENRIRDKLKDKYCLENDINLLRIPHWLKPLTVDSIKNLVADFIEQIKDGKRMHLSYSDYIKDMPEELLKGINVITYD